MTLLFKKSFRTSKLEKQKGSLVQTSNIKQHFRFCLLSISWFGHQHEGKLNACLSATQASKGLLFKRRCRACGAHGKRAAADRF